MFRKLKAARARIKRIRESNFNRYGKLKAAMLAAFPLVLIYFCELNQTAAPLTPLAFFANNPNVLAYVLIYELLIYAALLLLTRSVWAAMLLNTLAFFTFSVAEVYKFQATGTHFVFTDFVMAGDLSVLSSFTTIVVYPHLVANLAVLLAYVAAAYMLGIRVRVSRYLRSAALGVMSTAVLMLFILLPAAASSLSGALGIETDKPVNSFAENERYGKQHFLAFFFADTAAQTSRRIKPPAGYGETAVRAALLPGDASPMPAEAPNVIFVLGESFADFREIDPDVGTYAGVYTNFDLLASEGFAGVCVVPTFGGYTLRTEFEVIYGLPLYSLNTPTMPNMLINLKGSVPKPATVPAHYASLGYETVYIHPFNANFYNRDKVYELYGFDTMLFAEDFGEDAETFGKYISDAAVYAMALDRLKQAQNPCHMLITTMQNHVPYVDGKNAGTGGREFAAYIAGAAESDRALGLLRAGLLELERPTVLVFLGDHFPFLIAPDNKYGQLGISIDNCSVLYDQRYVVWANYDLDFSGLASLPEISLFYLPGEVTRAAGLPASSVMNTTAAKMASLPVYTQNRASVSLRDRELDLLTYDMAMGRRHAAAIDN